MRKINSKQKPATDWNKIDAMADERIDVSDIPPLDDSFFDEAKLRMPSKMIPVTLKVDEDVMDWFKAQGRQFENLMNSALRIYVEAHKKYIE